MTENTLRKAIENPVPLTKQEINSIADAILLKVMDGELNPLETHIKAKAIVQTFEKIASETQGYALDEAEKYGKEGSIMGVSFKISSTGDRYDYEADPTYKKLKDELKKREEVLKMAAKTTMQIADDDSGEIIPKVPLKASSKATLNVSIK